MRGDDDEGLGEEEFQSISDTTGDDFHHFDDDNNNHLDLPGKNESIIQHCSTSIIHTITKSSTVGLQYNGIALLAAKMPVYWSYPLFLDHYYTYNKKTVSSKNVGILEFWTPVNWSSTVLHL